MMLTCPECGHSNPRFAVECLKCSHKFAHRDYYPEQYHHPLVGAYVEVCTGAGRQVAGKVERVVPSRFGPLVHLEGNDDSAWKLEDCTPI
jgi:hypothetical protein